MLRGPDHMAMRIGSAMPRRFGILQSGIKLPKLRGQRAGHTAAQLVPVDFSNRRDAAKSAGHEGFFCFVDLVQREIAQVKRNALRMTQPDDVTPRDAVKA